MTTFFLTRYTLLVTFISDISCAAGVLAGLAIGDALGAPFEGGPPPGVPVRSFFAGGRNPRKAGEFTDDTFQALALAESLVACRGFSPEDFMARLLRDYSLHPGFYGPTSAAVISLVRSGTGIHEAASRVHATRGWSRSNGSVMRGAPIGVFFSGPEVEAVSYACSALTHADPVPGACSAFVNRMVSDMCRGIPRAQAHARALRRCRNTGVARVLGCLGSTTPVAGLDALEATHAALTVFMRSDRFSDCVSLAVGLGGDSDTVAAIAGALAGALYGFDGIPPEWVANLAGRERVLSVAHALWSCRVG